MKTDGHIFAISLDIDLNNKTHKGCIGLKALSIHENIFTLLTCSQDPPAQFLSCQTHMLIYNYSSIFLLSQPNP